MPRETYTPPPVRIRKGPKKPKLFSMGTVAVPNPYEINQKLVVHIDNEMKFIPCVPKPGAGPNERITRIPTQSVVTYKGYVETMPGAKVLCLSYKGIEVYVGTVATKFLVPLRKRKILGKKYR